MSFQLPSTEIDHRLFVFKFTFKNIPRRVACYSSFLEKGNHDTCLSFSLGIRFYHCYLFSPPVSITAEFQAHLVPFGTESSSAQGDTLIRKYLSWWGRIGTGRNELHNLSTGTNFLNPLWTAYCY